MSGAFRKFLVYSVVGHVAVLLFMLLSPGFGAWLPKKPTKVTWVKLSKGTGENPSESPFKKSKNLPDSTIREQKEALKEIAKDKKGADQKSVESKKKPVEKKPPVDQKKTSPNGAINVQKKKPVKEQKIDDALARIEQQLQKREVEIEAAQIEKEGTGQSPNGSLDVTTSDINAVLIKYVGDIIRKIQSEWITTPKTLADGQVLKTQIVVTIDSQGHVISTSFETKSGDATFDLSAMRAVERAAPFPPPPDMIKDEAVSEGFLIEFNPRSVMGGH